MALDNSILIIIFIIPLTIINIINRIPTTSIKENQSYIFELKCLKCNNIKPDLYNKCNKDNISNVIIIIKSLQFIF